MLRIKILSFLLAFSTYAWAYDINVSDLTCEYKQNPVGIDVQIPRLSWKINAKEGIQNVTQKYYQIQVSKTEKGLNNLKNQVWNSGKIQSNQSVHIKYKGEGLAEKQTYYWRVKIWDSENRETKWSEINHWEMGMKDSTSWVAKWISPALDEDENIDNPSPILRTDFNLKKKVKKARLYITSHGLYEAYLNGERVGDELFTPGWTSFHNRLQYQVFDVTTYMEKGENVVGVRLGDGWFRSPIGYECVRNFYGKELALLCQLEIEYIDGSMERIISDENWKAATGAILISSIYDGEIYDANQEQVGWNDIGFKNDNWQKVKLVNHPKKTLVASSGLPVKRIQEIKPVKLFTDANGDKIVDFGQNMVGWLQLNIKAKKGDTITIYHAEILDSEGKFYTENLRNADQKLQYIFKDKERVVFEPHFTFMGFRYVKVDFEGEFSKDNLKAIVIHSEMEPTGTFECSNPLINQLQSNIQWGQKGNFLDVPTDCPQRDERIGWTGDAQAFATTACYNFDCASFYTKWLADLKSDQKENGSVPFVIPNVLRGNRGSAGWGDASTIVPWTMYLKYGDKTILQQQYESMKKWVAYYKTISSDGLIVDKGYHFGDWLSYQNPKDLFSKPAYTDLDFLATAFYAYSTSILSKTAKILGKKEDHIYYKNLFEEIKQAFQEEFVSHNGRLSSHTQTAYTIALKFNLLDEEQKLNAVDYLEQNIVKRKIHLSTGFLGTPYLCKVLSDNGKTNLAYQLLTQETYPSWLYPITKGATTIWEHWDGIRPDNSLEDPYMNSYNHYAYGAIGDWMYSVVAGIQEVEENPGYKHIILKPKPNKLLSYAKASYKSVYGLIKSSWKTDGANIKLEVTVPTNTTATLHFPFSKKSPLELGSGNYVFEYKMKE